MPDVGDVLRVGRGKKMKYKKIKTVQGAAPNIQSEECGDEDLNTKNLNLIIRSDVIGSAEAIEESLEKINTDMVKVKIIRKGLGNISDGDIKRAEACAAIIIGFNVKTPSAIEEAARNKNIEIKHYNIIYDLINDIKEKMQALVEPTIKRKDLGKLKVMAVFKTEKGEQIVGGKIIEGNIEADSLIEVKRNQELLATGKLTRLQSGKQDVSLCETDQECGIQYKGKPVIEKGDVLWFYKEEKIVGVI